MYNEDVKLKFINEYTAGRGVSPETVSALLKAAEPIEKELGRDICAVSGDELRPLAKRLFPARQQNAAIRRRVFADYADWCMKNGVTGACDALKNLSVDEIVVEKVFSRTVSGPVHLQRYLDSIFHPVEERTVDNTYRVYFWLAFGGMAESRIFEVTGKDIDLEEMYADPKSQYPVPLYREAIPAFRSCMEQTVIKVIRPAYESYRNRCDGDQLIRGVAPATRHSVQLRISRALSLAGAGAADCRIGYHGAWISGMFYRMYERERAGFPVDFKPVTLLYMRTRGRQEYHVKAGKEKEKNAEYYASKLAKEYERDYINWKKSFSG